MFYNKIHELQDIRARLVSGEKPPEVVYVDREVPKYITTKHVIKSGMASGIVGASLVVYTIIGIAYAAGIFKVTLCL